MLNFPASLLQIYIITVRCGLCKYPITSEKGSSKLKNNVLPEGTTYCPKQVKCNTPARLEQGNRYIFKTILPKTIEGDVLHWCIGWPGFSPSYPYQGIDRALLCSINFIFSWHSSHPHWNRKSINYVNREISRKGDLHQSASLSLLLWLINRAPVPLYPHPPFFTRFRSRYSYNEEKIPPPYPTTHPRVPKEMLWR